MSERKVKKRIIKYRRKRRKAPHSLKIFLRSLKVVFSTLVLLFLFLIMTMMLLFHGPSEKARDIFTLSLNETSALKWIPHVFLSEETCDLILNPVSDEAGTSAEFPRAVASASVNTADTGSSYDVDMTVAGNDVSGNDTSISQSDTIEIIDIKGSTYKGKLMLVHDPSKVFFASIDSFGTEGMTLSAFLSKYDAVACTNAGGFEDEGGTGKGGIPNGIVIRDGAIVYGDPASYYTGVAGFDSTGTLHVGNMTGSEALSTGIVNGTSFENGPVLIQNGIEMTINSSGINPRTAIGQTSDGTVILVCIEGRMAESLGASHEDLLEIMKEYGAVNAVNMDGGSSSGMYYEGERITKSCSVVGDRPLPTAILVSR